MSGFVIVGGGPTALAAARSYRENGGQEAVLMISEDEALPYERPPLSKEYLRGDLSGSAVSGLGLCDSDELSGSGIDVRLNTPVTAVDPAGRTVTCADGETVGFSTCLLATGAEPIALPVPGGDDPRVHRLRSLADARRLRSDAERLRDGGDGRVVVLGSGFIGCEAAVSLARLGLRVTLLSDEPAPQRTRLGRFAAARLADWLSAEGVVRVSGREVRAIEVAGVGAAARFAVGTDGGTTDAGLVLSATGVAPRVGLAEGAGLALSQGRVRVDAGMRTTVDGVLAAGDVAAAFNPAAGRHLAVEHWGEALAMGEVAGVVAAGGDARWDAVPGFWSQIGDRQLKYAAWGDGFTVEHPVEHADGGFTVWYERDGVAVGVLTFEADDDYEAGSELIRLGQPVPG